MDPAIAVLDLSKAGAIIASMVESFLAGVVPEAHFQPDVSQTRLRHDAPPLDAKGARHDNVQDQRPAPVEDGLCLHPAVGCGAAAVSGIPDAAFASGVVVTSPPSCPSFPRPGLCYPCLSRLTPLRSYEGSDSCRPRTHPAGLSASFALPSEHPTPNHIVSLDIAFTVTSAHRVGPESPGFAMFRQARRTTPPKRVRYPAGCSFASGCSPPRLTHSRSWSTQLPSAT